MTAATTQPGYLGERLPLGISRWRARNLSEVTSDVGDASVYPFSDVKRWVAFLHPAMRRNIRQKDDHINWPKLIRVKERGVQQQYRGFVQYNTSQQYSH